jgi:hypothetical protein
MTFTADQVQQMCIRLLQGEIHFEALQVTLDEFRAFYRVLWQLKGDPPEVSLVNLETLVKGQFSNISPQHFDIQEKKPLTEDDFDFILERNWYGSRERPQGFGKFVLQELKQNWWKLIPVFVISVGLLYAVDDDKLYELVGTFLIQSTTVFLSIYLIFTVSQSQKLRKDPSLFKSGIMHRYYRDDRNITILGILTIGLTFLNSGVISLASTYLSAANFIWLQIVARALKAISTAIVVTSLFETFITVANYYLERDRDVAERDMASDILDEDYRRYLCGQEESQ